MRIGDLARQAGVSARALRYYEEQGLLTSERSPTGQRIYPESAVERVRLIQQFFTAGLASRTILRLMPCVDTGHGAPEVFALMAAERDRITAAMADLAAARDALDRMIDIANHPTPEHCPALREPPLGAIPRRRCGHPRLRSATVGRQVRAATGNCRATTTARTGQRGYPSRPPGPSARQRPGHWTE